MLTEHETALLKALVNCIIPPDDDPGGWEAGVGDYLFQQFERDLKDSVTMYQAGLAALDAEAKAVYRQGFADLSSDGQTTLLTRIERAQVESDWDVDPVAFFVMAVEHCTEGFYSNPENGGNRDGVAWDMIGFEVRG